MQNYIKNEHHLEFLYGGGLIVSILSFIGLYWLTFFLLKLKSSLSWVCLSSNSNTLEFLKLYDNLGSISVDIFLYKLSFSKSVLIFYTKVFIKLKLYNFKYN